MKKPKEISLNQKSNSNKPAVWDCGSSLYDSFELNSFNRQLDSAISSRSLSMPHLSDRRAIPAPAPKNLAPVPENPPAISAAAKKTSKITRSIGKLLRSVFKVKSVQRSGDGAPILVVYDKSGALTTIPEAPEFDFVGYSPEIASLVRRSGSERFVATSTIGISCA